MTAGRSAQAALLALATSTGAFPALAQDNLVRSLVVAADPQPFTADDLLWMEVQSDGVELADSLNVYASRGGVFVPIGELSRVLDLAVGVFPAQRRAEGWILSPDQKLVVDLAAGEARLNGRRIAIGAGQAAIYDNDLYMRTDLLEQLLPLKLKADASAQILTLTPTQPLPFQQRAERAQRQAQLGGASGDEGDTVRVETPYVLFSPPSFDVNIGGQLARDGVEQAGRYDVRVANDLLLGGFEGYVGSDDDGQINSVRVMLSRKDPYGHALGRLGGTRAGLGDVFSPSMAIGAAGFGGRGVFYSSAPLENLDLATPLNLRGELALGEEVELYVNEVLQRAQTSPVQGRYEFLDIPLAFGLNTIRLVFYGSQGQSREVVRRINFGTGQVEPGKLIVRLGAVEQGLTVFDVGADPTDRAAGAARVVATVDYGLTPGLTLSGGAARYDPRADGGRSLGSLGLRGSLGGIAVQVDAAVDDLGGQGISTGFATRAYGVSLVGRHSEYDGGFIDETRQLGTTDQTPLARASDLRADGQISGPGTLTVPVSLNLRRLERSDGTRMTNAELRASAPINRYYVSSSVAYQDDSDVVVGGRSWTGATDVASLITARLQTRAGVSYELSPDPEFQTAYATADWQLNERAALRLGMIRTLGPAATTSYQASQLWRASRFDLAVNIAYETATEDWRLGLQLGFGFGYDPGRGHYDITRPGVAGGGSAAINAWVDENGDGVRQASETGIAGIVADTPAGADLTPDSGRLFVTGLGDAATARIRLNTEAVDDPYLIGGPTTLLTVPRPGRAARIDYPMQRSGEVQLTALLRRDGTEARPLSALNIQLIPEGRGRPIDGRSDHAGVIFLETVPAGTYSVRLDETQARTLGVSIVDSAPVVVPARGGFVDAGSFEVVIAGGPTQ